MDAKNLGYVSDASKKAANCGRAARLHQRDAKGKDYNAGLDPKRIRGSDSAYMGSGE
jgi:hypothetical protein